MNITILLISSFAIAGVIIRPFRVAEAWWAVSGALILFVFGLLTFKESMNGVVKGMDVYLFLVGMMLLAETAREEKLFDWLAAHATRMAQGSAVRLYFLIYLVGVLVTTFLSNDATAVVLTPAVAAAVKAAKVKKPLPYLLICAFIANAASFVLPISNPANLVIYGSHLPGLGKWLSLYALPAVVAISVTYILLRFIYRKELVEPIETDIAIPSLSKGGQTALIGIGATAIILLWVSALNIGLGWPTAITGILTSAVVIAIARKNPKAIFKGISWTVLPLVAGLFVIVGALNKTGLTQMLSHVLQQQTNESLGHAVWGSGLLIAYASNLFNNLPLGLISGDVMQAAHAPEIVKSAVLIGIDLGPNLSITGSLATILWLVALRREGIEVSAWAFLKVGFLVMSVALLFTLVVLAM